MSASSPTESLTITVDDQISLEGEFRAGDGQIGVVITHPHPLHGGSMHTPVPECLFDAATNLSLPALRFNFRGVGASTGTHDNGVGERADVQAAVNTLVEHASIDQAIIAGWSFGADVGLAIDSDQIVGWFAVAAPLSVVSAEEMLAASADKPKVLAVPEHDQFTNPEAAASATASWNNTSIETVPGADHFLAGRLNTVAELFDAFVGTVARPQ